MPIRFTLDKRENYDHECTIRLSWSWSIARFQTTIGQRIKAVDWDNVRQRVRPGAHNSNGVYAESINATLQKLFSMVYAMERLAHTYNKVIFPFMMKGAVKDVLSNNFTNGDDVAAKWLYASEYQETTKIKYFHQKPDHYFKLICTAYSPLLRCEMYVMQELFGEGRIIVESCSEFRGKVSIDYEYGFNYREVDEDEALGRRPID